MTHPYGSDPSSDQPDHSARGGQGAGAPTGQPGEQWGGAQPPAPDYGAHSQPQPAYGGAAGTPADPMYAGGAAQSHGTPGQPSPALSRPPTVLIASVLAWIGAAVLLFVGVSFLAARDMIMSEFAGQVPAGVGDIIVAVGGFFLVWALAIIVLAVFAFRGAMWAVWVLTVLGGLFALLALLGVAGGSAESLIPILWVGASIALYLVPNSREWYRAKRRIGSGGGDFNPGVYSR